MQNNIATALLTFTSLVIYYIYAYHLNVTWRIDIITTKQLPSLLVENMSVEDLVKTCWSSFTAMTHAIIGFMAEFSLPILQNNVG